MNPEKHFLGSLCKRNHNYENTGKTVRYIKHKGCVQCQAELQERYREENKDKLKTYHKKYYQDNKETLLPKIKMYSKKYYEEHKKEIYLHRKEQQKLYRQRNAAKFKKLYGAQKKPRLKEIEETKPVQLSRRVNFDPIGNPRMG